ncbi:MAG: Gfo/Idh/MocA family oxidoreductase [Chloroflexota bacterium]|nr:Gfo/Idh/MocA family oxidoreductase [Chloroflexota bacterium]
MTPTGSPTGLRAVVVGAGFAGEGHASALRESGVAVEAICSRTAATVEATAGRLGIPRASTDWRRTLADVRPEVIGVATPADAHREIVEAAVGLGCHVFYEKPLAPNAPDARRLYELATAAGVKHAYAATHRYDPSVTWLVELVRSGTIGQVAEVESNFRRTTGELIPWSWYDSIALGGGLLHNALPHWLGILQRVLGGEVLAAMGEARVFRHRAPYVPNIHDFRLRDARRPTAAEAAQLEWRECDSDNAFTALFRIGAPTPERPAHASVAATPYRTLPPPNGFRFHGSGGTLRADGHFSYTVFLHRTGTPDDAWEELPLPERIVAAHPAVGTEFERKWTALARDFVAAVRGRPHEAFLTFRDGARFQRAFDAIRAGGGWTRLEDE